MATNSLSTASQKSNRRALLVAVVFGILSAVLVVSYLNSTRAKDNSAGLVTVPAVFALRDIPERTQIKDGMIEVRMIVADARHPLAVQDKQRAVSQITRVPIAAGEQILSSKIADQVRDVGFSAQVPEGKRAVAIAVTEVIASGGHITPGDFVDVIAVLEVNSAASGLAGAGGGNAFAGNNQGEKPKVYTSATIMQNLQVLAVAEKADPTLQNTGDKKLAKGEDAKSVTLAVTPEQAARLFMAEELGKLRLSLRPFGENEQRKIDPAFNSLSDLFGL